jgi:hypothetical protein
MKVFYLLMVMAGSMSAFSQQEYFTPENKKVGLTHYQKLIYQGCSDLKEKQDLISVPEIKKLTEETSNFVSNTFSKAFAENPKIKTAFLNEVRQISLDPSCQRLGNHCRARLLSTALYYYQQFRADLPGCEVDQKNSRCEDEKKFRKSSFQGVHQSHYGSLGVGTYKKELIAVKNNTTDELVKIIVANRICNPVLSGVEYRNILELNEPGDFYTDLIPDFDLAKHIPDRCKDEKKNLLSDFIQTPIDDARTRVGLDDAEPVRKKIIEFMKANPDWIVTDISVTASAAKVPFYHLVNNKKAIDPKSNERALALAKDRSTFISKILSELKASHSKLAQVTLKSPATLAGPDFDPRDLNDRFVTRMTASYFEKIAATFGKHKKLYETEAFKHSHDEFFDESLYPNLFQVKYKPFQGYRIEITGYKKEEMKCLDNPAIQKNKAQTSKQ